MDIFFKDPRDIVIGCTTSFVYMTLTEFESLKKIRSKSEILPYLIGYCKGLNDGVKLITDDIILHLDNIPKDFNLCGIVLDDKYIGGKIYQCGVLLEPKNN